MKKIAIPLLISFPIFSYSQNVGIGTTAPLEKLEVKNAFRSTLRISSNSFNDTTELLLSNRNGGNSGTDFSLKNIREEGLFFSSLSDLPANNSSNSLILRPNGNVGIGMLPNYKFHVTGQSRFNGLTQIEGLNLFEFGAGILGKEINAGKIGYNAFGQNALTFVGAGTNATNRAFYFFGEGGTTFNGPATITGNTNIGGQLQVNGNAGTSGQVLTSNGTADPTWQNTAYGNTTRFALYINEPSLNTVHTLLPITTDYNLNTSDVSISSNNITFNKTGLYHFDIYINTLLGSASQVYLNFYLYSGGIHLLDFLKDEQLQLPSGYTLIRKNYYFSINMHITAPRTMSFAGYYLGGSGGGLQGKVYCNLINE